MQIHQIETKMVKPDPEQPRQTFDQKSIEEIAISIKTEGVINAIEVDKDYIIITGEKRWRASKVAGLETIPCKIFDINKKDRFLRQVIENIHHNTMTYYDTAKSYERLLKENCLPPSIKWEDYCQSDEWYDGIRWINRKTGRSTSAIKSCISTLDQSAEWQEAVKLEKISGSFIEVLKGVDPQFRNKIEKKVLNGDIKLRDGARRITKAIRENPNQADEILKLNFSNCETVDQYRHKLREIVSDTPLADMVGESYRKTKSLGNAMQVLFGWMDKNPKGTIARPDLKDIITYMTGIKTEAEKWLEE